MRYKQGKYTPENPEKYVGNPNDIVYRSSWEFHLMRFCDKCPSILRWNSEGVVIPYYFPLDQKMHRYFVDFVVEYKDKDGNIIKELIEVKPEAEYNNVIKRTPDGRNVFREDNDPPPPPKRRTRKSAETYMRVLETWQKNKAKWMAASKWAEQNGMGFRVMTESQLGLKKKK